MELHSKHGKIAFAKENYLEWSWKRESFTSPAVFMESQAFPAELTNDEWRKGQRLPPLRGTLRQPKALVPSVPVHLRPSNLDELFILWEPTWNTSAPEDPLLLKHVSGPIYSILAQWDLTPLERAVLEGRLL